jgi:multidrug efflux pump subunit AcrA (membrane-fusion protein)
LSGSSFTGLLTSLSGVSKTSGSIGGGAYLPATIKPDTSLPVSMIGQDVQVTVTTAHSAGPVLAVPEAAIFSRANGSTYVTRVTASDTEVTVAVQVGVTGGGLVQVTPTPGGSLAAGDRVVTGESYSGANPAGSGLGGLG